MTKYYHTLKVNKHGVLATVFVVDSTRILAYFDSELVKHTSLKYVIFRTENFFSLAKEHFVINSQTQPHALIVHSFNGLVGWIRTKKLPKNLEINGLLAMTCPTSNICTWNLLVPMKHLGKLPVSGGIKMSILKPPETVN